MPLPPLDDTNYVWFRKTIDGLLWMPVTVEGRIVVAIWILANIWNLRKQLLLDTMTGDAWIDVGFFTVISTLILLGIIHLTKGRRWD